MSAKKTDLIQNGQDSVRLVQLVRVAVGLMRTLLATAKFQLLLSCLLSELGGVTSFTH